MKALRNLCAALLGLAMMSAAAQIAVDITVDTAPPVLPVYDQPPMPEPGYLWTPGYWAWGPAGYYWVPGTWVMAPEAGLLWTPPWWGWANGRYLFHSGYWGPHVGFYGGINYGFGYGGDGFHGGRWEGGVFAYNRSVTNFGSVHVTNVYNETVVNRTVVNKVSFNGGSGGVHAQPTQADRLAEHDQHMQPTPVQAQHIQSAAGNHGLLASENHGRPAVAAAVRPGEFTGAGAIAAHANSPQPPAPRPAMQPARPQVPTPVAQQPHPAAPPPQQPHPQAPPQAAHPQPQHPHPEHEEHKPEPH